MADVPVKPEIKLDPADDGGDRTLADVEEFEEDTDLQFPTEGTIGWFARVPEGLWAAWHEAYKNAPDDSQLEIGKMRVYKDKGDGGDLSNQKIEMRLHDSVPQTRGLPQDYSLKIQTNGYSNTVVFSEKDLPGHATRTFGRNRHFGPGGRPTGVNKNDRYGGRKGRYASAIPKQTALAPQIQHEALVTASVDSASFFADLSNSMQSQTGTRFQLGVDRKLQHGRNTGAFSSFTTSSKPLKGRKKPPREKAVRIDQDQMYDALYRCFRRYKYWSLKALRNELQQPEAYIKSSLETVANLIRSGDFATQWVLKPEYAPTAKVDPDEVKQESAVVESAGEDATDMGTGDELDDDDDLAEMEDVKMDQG